MKKRPSSRNRKKGETPEQNQKNNERMKAIYEKDLRLYKDQRYDIEQEISSPKKQIGEHKSSSKEYLIDMPVVWEEKLVKKEEELGKINDLIRNIEEKIRDIEWDILK